MHEAELVAYYNNEVEHRSHRELPPQRITRRTGFLRQLQQEGRGSILEIGTGPGREGLALAAAGSTYTGIDLARNSVAACRSLGLDAYVASVLHLPFRSASFDAGWSMSTLLHVPDADLDVALAEIARVLRPGSPIAIGVWGDEEASEGPWGDGTTFGPPRFFSTRTDEGWHAALSRHGTVEQWATWPGEKLKQHYQWAVLRTPA